MLFCLVGLMKVGSVVCNFFLMVRIMVMVGFCCVLVGGWCVMVGVMVGR